MKSGEMEEAYLSKSKPMPKLQLETLSPIHIGSGRELQENIDYVYFRNENNIAKIDERKIFELIGEENLDKWVSIIDNGEQLIDYLEKRGNNLQAQAIAQRIMKVTNAPSSKPIREQVHTGMGQAFIPGSSLKGSIRTVLLTYMIYAEDNDKSKDSFVDNINNLQQRFRGRSVFKDSQIIKHYFGKDPNHDLGRYILVGDVVFENLETECVLSKSFNLFRDRWGYNNRIEQVIECIPSGAKTQVNISFDNIRPTIAKKEINNIVKHIDFSILNLTKLFSIANEHTKGLINNELGFWQDEDDPDIVTDYVNYLEHIEKVIENCGEKECVLRLGYGTGWKNMTGDWIQDFLSDENAWLDVTNAVRHPKYEGLPFPKSRRVGTNDEPLGFVKLTML